MPRRPCAIGGSPRPASTIRRSTSAGPAAWSYHAAPIGSRRPASCAGPPATPVRRRRWRRRPAATSKHGEEARNAIGACRYPKLPGHPLYDLPGIRGDAPVRAARYLSLSQQDYYRRADVWPLTPNGEILAIIQCEDTRAIENLPRILRQGLGGPAPATRR